MEQDITLGGTMTDVGGQDQGKAGALSRRQSRRKAFELLFELEYRPGLTPEAILERTFSDEEVIEQTLSDEDADGYVTGSLDPQARRFINELVLAVTHNTMELDDELRKYPHEWSYDRIGITERVLLRLALAEMRYLGTTHKVVINESLDLAKQYAQSEARRFINGILGAVIKSMQQDKGNGLEEDTEE
jgi:N utilization substance protein B